MNRIQDLKNQNTVTDKFDGNGNLINNRNFNIVNELDAEKAAAKIFPLNIISGRFKINEPETMKGKISFLKIHFIHYVFN